MRGLEPGGLESESESESGKLVHSPSHQSPMTPSTVTKLNLWLAFFWVDGNQV